MENLQNIIDSRLLNEDSETELTESAMLAKCLVPYSHRRLADNYAVLKRICGFQVAQPQISFEDKQLLAKYNFDLLENTTILTVNDEIKLMKLWAISTEDALRTDSIELLKIRVKELKFVLSNRYASLSNELCNGYKALECYLLEITKYYTIN